jgi:hypothetical protein
VRGCRAVTLAGRAVTLRSAQLPLRMVAVAVALAQVLQQRALAVAEAVSGQKVQLPPTEALTAVVVVAVAQHRRV